MMPRASKLSTAMFEAGAESEGGKFCLPFLSWLGSCPFSAGKREEKKLREKLETPAYGAAIHGKDVVQRREKASICMLRILDWEP